MIEGVKRRNEQSGRSKQGRGTGEGMETEGRGGRGRGRECKRASRIGWAHDGARVARACSTLKWSLATKKRDAMAALGRGGAGFPTSFRSLFGLISWAGRQRGKLIGIH